MTPEEAGYRMVSGKYYSDRADNPPAPDPVDWIRKRIDEVGKAQAMAEAGIKRETLRRWLNGSQRPSKRARGLIAQSAKDQARRRRLTARRESRLRAGRIRSASITGTICVSSDCRPDRTADLRDVLRNNTDLMGRMVDAYLNRDDDRLAEFVQDALGEWVPGAYLPGDGDDVGDADVKVT